MKTACILSLAIAAGVLQAQDKTVQDMKANQEMRSFTMNRTVPGSMGMKIEAATVAPIKGAPYSADAVTESTQVLGDGNRIVNKSSAFVARDSQGRTRNEAQVEALGLVSANGEAAKIIMLHDPVAQVTYTLETGSKTARKTSTSPNLDEAKLKAAKAKMEAEQRFSTGGFKSPATVTKESLGSQMIEGVLADGTRTTETIPAGAIGNEKDIQVVNEVWVAQELKAIVMSKHSDPRVGESTFKLTNILRSEPDPALFSVPAGYQIVDQPAKPFIMLNTRE
jgi:hypothetical protein